MKTSYFNWRWTIYTTTISKEKEEDVHEDMIKSLLKSEQYI